MFPLGGAEAVYTNRIGGRSSGEYATLNLGDHVGDNSETVIRNRQIVEKAIGRKVVWMNQTHSNRVVQVHPGYTQQPQHADGIIVDAMEFQEVGLAIPAAGVLVADCVPVLLASDDGRIVAAIHAGRAGVFKNIVRQAALAIHRLGVPANRLHAAIGPSICGNCYEVPEEMRQHVTSVVPATWARNRWGGAGLDLRAGVKTQLGSLGIRVSFVSKRCTYEDPNLYSYRRNSITGRFAGIVCAQEKPARRD